MQLEAVQSAREVEEVAVDVPAVSRIVIAGDNE